MTREIRNESHNDNGRVDGHLSGAVCADGDALPQMSATWAMRCSESMGVLLASAAESRDVQTRMGISGTQIQGVAAAAQADNARESAKKQAEMSRQEMIEHIGNASGQVAGYATGQLSGRAQMQKAEIGLGRQQELAKAVSEAKGQAGSMAVGRGAALPAGSATNPNADQRARLGQLEGFGGASVEKAGEIKGVLPGDKATLETAKPKQLQAIRNRVGEELKSAEQSLVAASQMRSASMQSGSTLGQILSQGVSAYTSGRKATAAEEKGEAEARNALAQNVGSNAGQVASNAAQGRNEMYESTKSVVSSIQGAIAAANARG